MTDSFERITINGKRYRLTPDEQGADALATNIPAEPAGTANLNDYFVVRAGDDYVGSDGVLVRARNAAAVFPGPLADAEIRRLESKGDAQPERLPASVEETIRMLGQLMPGTPRLGDEVKSLKAQLLSELGCELDAVGLLWNPSIAKRLRAVVATVLKDHDYRDTRALLDAALTVGTSFLLEEYLAASSELRAERQRTEELSAQVEHLQSLIRDPDAVGVRVHDNWLEMGFEGAAAQVLASAFAEQFKQSKSVNYIEMALSSTDPEIGPLLVTIQRRDGETPHQLREKAERKLVEFRQKCIPWLKALKSIADDAMPIVSSWHVHQRKLGDEDWVNRCTRWIQDKMFLKGTLPEPEVFNEVLAEAEECPFRGYRLRASDQ